MTRNSTNTLHTDPRQLAEAAESARRRDFIERMEQKLRSKELAHMAQHQNYKGRY